MNTKRAFMAITRRMFLKMRNVSHKSCREVKKKHVFSNIFPKIVRV